MMNSVKQNRLPHNIYNIQRFIRSANSCLIAHNWCSYRTRGALCPIRGFGWKQSVPVQDLWPDLQTEEDAVHTPALRM